jgi:endonuclease/exonuclease/phosphatase family metal-dependent hydrolase
MKNITVKLLSLLLAVIMTAALFVACTPGGDNNPESTPEKNEDTEPIDTEPIETDLPTPTEDIDIIKNKKGTYKIIRGENAEDFEKNAATTLVTTLRKETGVLVDVGEDFINEKLGLVESDYEILVGKTNREASKIVYDRLRTDDYAVTVVGTKIVIAAFTEEQLNAAVNHFLESLVTADGNTTFPASKAVIMGASYDESEISVAGKPLTRYDIIYGKDADASVKKGAELFAQKLAETFKYSLDVLPDSTAESKYEIVFGGTTRGDSKTRADAIRTRDYSFYMEGSKIYVIPGSNEATYPVVADAFVAELKKLVNNGKIEITADGLKLDYANPMYLSDNIIIDGTPITDYTIVYPTGNNTLGALALYLNNEIEKICGRKLKISADNKAAAGKEIILGATKRTEAGGSAAGLSASINELGDSKFYIYNDGEFIYLGGKKGDTAALVAAVNRAIIKFKSISAENNAISLTAKEVFTVNYEKYSVITYNDGDNSTTKPKEIATIINEYAPDFIGMQEVQKIHVKIYEGLMPGYKGVYYDHDRSAYGAPIFYRTDKFELLESGTQWLSDTPDKISSYPESDYIRSYVYAIFKDKATGREFVMVNTHVDYIDAANRLQVAKLLELTNRFKQDMPVFYTGDFNVRQTGNGFKQMTNAGFLPSFNYIKYPDSCGSTVGSTMDTLIDYCFVDANRMVGTLYDVIDDHDYSASASDHLPIFSEIAIVS